eukprot:790389-Alexandrium_andersonii.AAC.1
MKTPARTHRLAYPFDKHMQQVAYLALASSTPQFMRVAAQGNKMKNDWLDDLGAVLRMAPMDQRNRPPQDIDNLLNMTCEDGRVAPL